MDNKNSDLMSRIAELKTQYFRIKKIENNKKLKEEKQKEVDEMKLAIKDQLFSIRAYDYDEEAKNIITEVSKERVEDLEQKMNTAMANVEIKLNLFTEQIDKLEEETKLKN